MPRRIWKGGQTEIYFYIFIEVEKGGTSDLTTLSVVDNKMDGWTGLSDSQRTEARGWFKQFNVPLVPVLFFTLAATKIHGYKNSLSELQNAKPSISHTSSDQNLVTTFRTQSS